jgi:hypothetical protein
MAAPSIPVRQIVRERVRRHRLISRLSAAREKARARQSAIVRLSLTPPAPPVVSVVAVESEYQCLGCRHRFVAFALRPCPACAGRVVHRVDGVKA